MVAATALFSAQAGIMLNGTLLNEAYLAGIAADVSALAALNISALANNLSALAASLGAVSDVSALVAEYASLAPVQLSGPPECGPPGGDQLQYVNGNWICVCAPSWFGVDCTSVYNVTTLAGNGNRGFADGAGPNTQWSSPSGVAVDSAGNAYVADSGNHCIRVVSPTGTVSTLAGNGNVGFANGVGTSALFNNPKGVAVDSSGNVYVADSGNHRIRVVSPSGSVSTLAGSGSQGFANGAGLGAQFYSPFGVAVDSVGTVYVADYNNHRIRVISPSGSVSTLAGSGSQGFANGAGPVAQFYNPSGVAVDSAGNVYVADYNNHRIRVVSPSGTASTLAGSGVGGFADGVGPAAQFYLPYGVAVESAGNVYVADSNNQRIRVVSPSSGIVSTLAGCGSAGFTNGAGPVAQFYNPAGVAVDNASNVFVAEYDNFLIRKLVFTTIGASLPLQTEPVSPLVTSLSALATQLADLAVVPNISALVAEYASVAPVQLSGPPDCGPPGGQYLQYVGNNWVCVCGEGWTGSSCTVALNGLACLFSPVFCEALDVQLFGTASQISTYPNQLASNANDNSTLCDNPANSGLASTEQGTGNWWQLDLGASRVVDYVSLFGRLPGSSDSTNLAVWIGAQPSPP
jgi:hypothetical protein